MTINLKETPEISYAKKMLNRFGDQILLAKTQSSESEAGASPLQGKDGIPYTLDLDSGRWNRPGAEFKAMFYRLVEEEYAELKTVGMDKDADKALKVQTAENARKVARNLYPVYLLEPEKYPDVTFCFAEQIDESPIHIGAPNGIIELTTGRLLSPEEGRKHLVSATIRDPYDPEAAHPDTERLFSHLSPELRSDVLSQIAFSLFGRPSRRFGVWQGPKASGKSTVIEALIQAFYNYVGILSEGAFSPKRGSQASDSANQDMTSVMPPVRLAFTDEMESVRVDSGRIKALVGGSTHRYRELYGKHKEQVPSATPIFVGNSAPYMGLSDAAVADRLFATQWPEIKDRAQHMASAFGHKSTQEGAQVRRQALVAKIIRLCTGLNPDAVPIMSDGSESFKAQIVEDGLSDVEEALKNNVQLTGNVDHKLGTVAIYDAVIAALGDPKNKPTKKHITECVKKVFDLPPASRMTIAGHATRGWRGLRLIDDGDKPFVEYDDDDVEELKAWSERFGAE